MPDTFLFSFFQDNGQDGLHLARSGELFDLPALDADRHPYIQLCDGPLACGDDHQSLLADALDRRSPPGEGELPLGPMLEALPPDTPLSLEVRSKPCTFATPQSIR